MKVFRDNGLTIVLLAASLATVLGMLLTGFWVYNSELLEHHSPSIDLIAYMQSGHFLGALFENWESEFLQMSAYVVLTAFLFQRGSSESNDPDELAPQDDDPEKSRNDRSAPWPVRVGGIASKIYSYSLGTTLFVLFVVSFVLHLQHSAAARNAEAALHGQAAGGMTEHLVSAQFWFESFQNWQSEFLSTAVIVVLSIFLRFRGSPESKPVAASHSDTGG